MAQAFDAVDDFHLSFLKCLKKTAITGLRTAGKIIFTFSLARFALNFLYYSVLTYPDVLITLSIDARLLLDGRNVK